MPFTRTIHLIIQQELHQLLLVAADHHSVSEYLHQTDSVVTSGPSNMQCTTAKMLAAASIMLLAMLSSVAAARPLTKEPASSLAMMPDQAAPGGRKLAQANVWLPGIVRVKVDEKGNTDVGLGPGGLFKISGRGEAPPGSKHHAHMIGQPQSNEVRCSWWCTQPMSHHSTHCKYWLISAQQCGMMRQTVPTHSDGSLRSHYALLF
jgi:hypothetical protein